MARLSQHVREQMAKALVQHRFAERGAELVAESQSLFRLCYEAHHSAEDRKNIAALVKRHPQGLSKVSGIDVNVSGRRGVVGTQIIGRHWKCETEARRALNDWAKYPGMGIDADSEMGARVTAFLDGCAKLTEEVEIANREALGALTQFGTGKRLAEDWPEAMPVIGKLIPENDRALPVVQVANLNSKFDLPPAKAA